MIVQCIQLSAGGAVAWDFALRAWQGQKGVTFHRMSVSDRKSFSVRHSLELV